MKFFIVLLACILPLSAFAQTSGDAKLFAYETAETVPMGAVFGSLPKFAVDDELLSVTSPVAETVEIHSMQDDNGIMKMRKVESLPLPKDAEVVLAPTGYHIMLIKLKAPLKYGEAFPVTLNFKQAGAVTIDVPVTTRKAK